MNGDEKRKGKKKGKGKKTHYGGCKYVILPPYPSLYPTDSFSVRYLPQKPTTPPPLDIVPDEKTVKICYSASRWSQLKSNAETVSRWPRYAAASSLPSLVSILPPRDEGTKLSLNTFAPLTLPSKLLQILRTHEKAQPLDAIVECEEETDEATTFQVLEAIREEKPMIIKRSRESLAQELTAMWNYNDTESLWGLVLKERRLVDVIGRESDKVEMTVQECLEGIEAGKPWRLPVRRRLPLFFAFLDHLLYSSS